MKQYLKSNLFILSILIFALTLRLWGINHGFPYIYHPDEPTVVREALTLKVHRFNPGHFDWPHLQIYLSFIVFGVFYSLRTIFGLKDFFYPDPVIFYLLGRLLAAFMGGLTIFFVYLVGQRLFSKKVGLLAALFLGINTLHVSESHVATVDVPMTFWLVVSFFFSVKIFKEGRMRDYLLAGLFSGLATSTKYNGGLIVLPIILAHFSRTLKVTAPETIGDLKTTLLDLRSSMGDFKKLVIAALAALGGFFLGTPFALLDAKTFFSTKGPEGAFWQFYHVGDQGIEGGVLERYSSLVKTNIFASQGLFMSIFSFLGIYFLLQGRKKSGLILLPFLTVYFFYVGTFSYSPAHFFLPIYPFLSLLAAVGFFEVLNRLKKFLLLGGVRFFYFLGISLLVVSLSPILSAAKADYILTQKDTRTLALAWLVENFEPGAVFALGGDYEPDFENTGFDTVNLHQILNGKDLSGAVYPYFHEKNISYVILGGFDLDEQLKKIEWDPNEPNFSHYVLKKGHLIKRFEPVLRPGPLVLVYEVDYEWEASDGKGFEGED